ncbi:MAG TPA: DUF3108 domain-containing protein, partial [bacterium]|nr:DUF3108 domain-containing protein [bacterium]
ARLDQRSAAVMLAIVAAAFVMALALLLSLASALKAAPLLSAEATATLSDAAAATAQPQAADRRPLLIDGEKLDFDIYYGALPAGHASLEVKSDATADGAIYRITSQARSNTLVSVFFTVDDRAVSEIDAATCAPRNFEKRISEGSFKKQVTVRYDSDGSVEAGDETFRVEPGTRDILSALYYVRGQDLHVGEDVIVRTFENGKCYRARVRVLGREKVSTHRGDYQCLVVEPEITEGIFAKAGRVFIYLTDDALKVPVLVKSKVKIGSFVAELVGQND